jgi:hypothetical protein
MESHNMKHKGLRLAVLLGFAVAPCCAGEPAVPAALKNIGMNREGWIAARADGQAGTGTAADPLDGSTQEKFDRLLIGLNRAKVTNITIHLGPGTFQTLGGTDWRNPDDLRDPCTGWRMGAGWKLVGAGMNTTTVKFAGYCHEFRHRAAIAATGGVWRITSAPDWFGCPDIWQGIRLVEGRDLKGLELGRIYYLAEQLDAERFRVSATPGGPPLGDVSIGADGICYRIVKVRRGGELMSTVIGGEGPDLEVRDLTVDINWPGFGAAVTEDFTMPPGLQAVTVAVESVDWARPLSCAWVYLVTPLKVHKPIGHFELVRVVDNRHVELRNMQGFTLRSGQPFKDEGTVNVPPGTVVAKGTRLGPEMVTAGVLVEGDRARVERVRVTQQAGTWYEGGCSIGVGSWGGPPYRDMAVRGCVVDTLWGGLAAGIHILSRTINGGARPKAGEALTGAQGVLEGNTILANGVFHSGLGVGGAINTVIRSNTVVNAGCGLYSEGPLRNVVISDNRFLDCPPAEAGIVVNCNWTPTWNPDKAYRPGDLVLWDEDEYRAKVFHVGRKPAAGPLWEAYATWVGEVVVERNQLKVCDQSGGIAFYGCSKGVTIRDNVIGYAPGCGKGSFGLAVSGHSNRRFVITGNVVEARLRNDVSANSAGQTAVVLGRDNVDELGRPRAELETGPAGRAQGAPLLPATLGSLRPASDPRPAGQPAEPLVAELGPRGEIQNWLILGPFPHPLGAGYGFDFLAGVGGETNARPRTGDSVAVTFPDGPAAGDFWKASQLKPRRIAWQRAGSQHCPVGRLDDRRAYREWVDVRPLLGTGEDTDNTCAYAACILRADAETPARFYLGSDDGNVLCVNGAKLGQTVDDRRMYVLDSDVHGATLHAGDNLVLLKICNATGGFNFGMRVTSAVTADLAVPGGAVPRGVKVVLP